MSILLTLPPHLLEKIEAIITADIGQELGLEIHEGLKQAQRDVIEFKKKSATTLAVPIQTAKNNGVGSKRSQSRTKINERQDIGIVEQDGADDEPNEEELLPHQPPPTIDEEILLALSKWARTDIGPVILKRKGLDPVDYSLISLLAGTEVYVSPESLARLKAAENPEQPNPFLPSYLSPKPPSLGSEYRQLTRNLTTALNILFSIFGSAGAVYAASVGGAGYTRETAMLLAILAGVVVGIADGVLVWIFSIRVKNVREEGEKMGREIARGSAVGLGTKKVDDEVIEGLNGEKVTKLGDVVVEGTVIKEKREIRLRRRAVGEHSGS